jgi:hypothetical protein
MTAKGAHKTGSKKTGTPPRRASARAEGVKRKTQQQGSRGDAKQLSRAGTPKAKRGKVALTSMFTVPTPVDSIEALTGPDPIVNDDNPPRDQADVTAERAAAGAPTPRPESRDEREARKRRRKADEAE